MQDIPLGQDIPPGTRASTDLALVILGLIVLLGISADLADQAGWIPHTLETPVWIGGDWLVTETRDCAMQTTAPPVHGMTYSREYLRSLPRMFCDSTPDGMWNFYQSLPETDRSGDQAFKRQSHQMNVTYWGRLNRPEKFRLDWRCTRDTDSISCKATNEPENLPVSLSVGRFVAW